MKHLENLSREEVEEQMKNHPDNSICMQQHEDGYFELKYAHPVVPVFIVNEVLKKLHITYLECLPEDVTHDLRNLAHKCKVQRRWTIFWYAVSLILLAIIIKMAGVL